MSEPCFEKPVRVQLSPGRVRVIQTLREAADTLLNRWPSDGGRKHLAARKAMLAWHEGQSEAIAARKAFVAAATEAKVIVGD